MKNLFKLIYVYVLRMVLRLFYLIPIKKNRVMFTSYQGRQYSCNPRFIYEELNRSYKGKFELVWAFINPEKFAFLNEEGAIICKFRTFKYYYYVLTSKVVVVNTTLGSEVPQRKGQFAINTWHGGGNGGKRSGGRDDKTLPKLERIRNIYDSTRYQMILTSSATSLKNTVHGNLRFKGPVIGGTPRNDILVNQNANELYAKVRDFFGLSHDTKILLYAPTYRNQKSAEDNGLDYAQLRASLTERFGGNWVVLVRMHYFIKQNFHAIDNALIDASDYMDMQELLYAVDILITDYSSSCWDFTFTFKPCFLYCTDLKSYQSERDFYSPIDTWGYPVCETNDELCKAILDYDETAAVERLKVCHKVKGSFEEGHASKDVAKVIMAVTQNKALPKDVHYV